MKIATSEIVYDENIYPRNKVDMKLVTQYRDSIENLPQIVIDKKKRVIDGYHRLLAFRGENITELDVKVFESENDAECLLESIRLNATHGKQLTSEEKRHHAKTLYRGKIPYDVIISNLSISERTFNNYVRDERKEEKKEQESRILDMYLACYTQEEIAKDVDLSHQQVSNITTSYAKNGNIAEICKAPPSSLQYTNMWSFDACDPDYGEKGYPGRMPGQIIENLLWYYTQPFDLVLDPIAGSGTTIDVCKKMYRRYLGYDINPIETKGIKHNDISKTFPEWRIPDKPKLIVLDPPYASQKQGEYTASPNDLSNLSFDEFFGVIDKIAKWCKDVLHINGETKTVDGVVAFIISSSKVDGKVIDLGVECRNIFVNQGFGVVERVCVPYENAASMTGYWIDDAKKNKRMLRAYRDLLIMTPK